MTTGNIGDAPINPAELQAGIQNLKKLIRDREQAVLASRQSLVELSNGLGLLTEGLEAMGDSAMVRHGSQAAHSLLNAKLAEVGCLEIELECHKNNLELLESDVIIPGLIPRATDTEPNYLQLLYLQTFSLVNFYCIQFIPGLNLLNFVVNKRLALTEQQLAEEFQGDAEKLRALMKSDPKALKVINTAAAEVANMEPLLSWAATAYARGTELNPEQKLKHFSDPDWNKLVGLLQFLGDLPETMKPWPFLAALFQLPNDDSLETLVAEITKETKATAELPYQLPSAPMPRIPSLLSPAAASQA
jgi:hypothetical protein